MKVRRTHRMLWLVTHFLQNILTSSSSYDVVDIVVIFLAPDVDETNFFVVEVIENKRDMSLYDEA